MPKRKIFPFNSLPAELKNKIFFIALTDPNGVFFVSGLKHYRRIVVRETPSESNADGASRRSRARYHAGFYNAPAPDPPKEPRPPVASLVPNMIVLNRQMYAETQPILYGANKFAVEDTTALHGFLAGIGAKNCASLDEITIKGWGYSKAHKAMNHPALTLLTNALNLKRLHIDTAVHWDGPRKAARQLYRDGFHWLEALYAAKGVEGFDIIDLHKENWEQRWYRYSNPEKEQPPIEESRKEFKEELKKLVDG